MADDDVRRVQRRAPGQRPEELPPPEPGDGAQEPSSGRVLVGTYRAVVVGAVDPMARGRLQVDVPAASVSGAWADACLPPLPSGRLTLPAVGDRVWVTFEGGDADHPVWTGVTWEAAAAAEERTSGEEVLVTSATRVRVSAPMVSLESAMVTCSGVVKCDTLLATSVVAASYTPGAGNVW